MKNSTPRARRAITPTTPKRTIALNLYRYDFVGLLMHAEHLEAAKGVGPHTISVPRVRPADDIDPDTFDNGVPDDVFAKIVACIRIAVPYTGLIISTREPQAMREQLLELGVSQISGGSRTSVGGYVSEEDEDESTAQFNVYDNRSLDEVVSWLMELGYIPSFCTACYRAGFCHPNALMTLEEYLLDYASPEARALGEALIDAEMANEDFKRAPVYAVLEKNLADIKEGKRDLRF